ncbi:MAG TPA: SH3 domain-containing protein [Candidatus Acidoferrum sp.]|nr:SH3 domain-containing protein [Candidatus Acidoferrum sp.]
MKRSAKTFPFVICLLLPLVCKAQKLGQIECGRQEGYAYLYSSMATMEISTTLKCGQQVTILDRSDNFLHVRTETGEEGFVPLSNVGYLKRGAAPKASPRPEKRELTHYDSPARLAAASRPAASAQEIILHNQTPVHLKLGRELSSATAHVGEEVNFEVTQDVIVGRVIVISKGAPAVGAVTEAEPKKRMGKAGKLNVSVSSVVLANNEKISLRSFGADQSLDHKSGMTIPLMRGKDVTLSKDTEITAYVDGDLHLKASGFAAAPSATQALSQSESAKPQN